MPFVDLSQGVPVAARWIKLRYAMAAKKPGEPLMAKVWSGDAKTGVVLKGPSGEAFLRLDVPQTLSFERADGLDLSLKVVAYKISD